MPGFPGPLDVIEPDRELQRLKAMASIMRMIEQCRVGMEITIVPLPRGGYNVSHLPVEPEAATLLRDNPWPAPPPPIAAPVLDAEIERREDPSLPLGWDKH